MNSRYVVYKGWVDDRNSGVVKKVMWWDRGEQTEYHKPVASFDTYEEAVSYMNAWLERE